MEAKFEPAKTIIAKLGGEAEVARILRLKIGSPYRWQRQLGPDGTGGKIPAKHINLLLAAAKEKHVRLSLSDFFNEAVEAAS